MRAVIVVVGAAIISGGRLLTAQRAEPPHMAGGWELPGGKVDPGESDEDALVRECEEELAVKVRLERRVGGDWRLSDSALLRVWTARLVEGEPRALEHLALRWLTPAELYEVDWLPGDRPVIDVLAADAPAYGLGVDPGE
ncbi:(deoxy)nucleoside triphosphate pyrophosphohydrolase [Actinomadura chibensis]|uniref:8-oxo-dGTP diphosphatase n=1 Tax=Actinomadura chibensis TaxID=392828 RepID=A0A5D0NQT7_9ACTN|nr:(deoxy)nucleoside triphosphate pyrophosphohydrolase [Actinomadura chibensis]TYB46574.1 (deoxy)nucleoside triphosphate pyrophosphohydrolase [Actinomadura chibensis]